jgi:hypothetical protein
MEFELCRARTGRRKCSYCKEFIPNGHKFFGFLNWTEDVPYPVKSNCCMACAKDIGSAEFIIYLTDLINAVSGLQEQLAKVRDDGTTENPINQRPSP